MLSFLCLFDLIDQVIHSSFIIFLRILFVSLNLGNKFIKIGAIFLSLDLMAVFYVLF